MEMSGQRRVGRFTRGKIPVRWLGPGPGLEFLEKGLSSPSPKRYTD
jgi:hypothetical protein